MDTEQIVTALQVCLPLKATCCCRSTCLLHACLGCSRTAVLFTALALLAVLGADCSASDVLQQPNQERMLPCDWGCKRLFDDARGLLSMCMPLLVGCQGD